MTRTCLICKKKLKPGQTVVHVGMVIDNERRGDFVSNTETYVHIEHLITKEN